MRRYFGVDRILCTYDSTLSSGKEVLSRVSKGAYAAEPWVFYGKAVKEHHLILTTCRLLFVRFLAYCSTNSLQPCSFCSDSLGRSLVRLFV